MKKYDSIIIGGGLGGLFAGALLAKKGWKVLLLEQHYIPGGCATTFKRKDFVMEVGLHEMDGLDKYDLKTRIFEELDIFKNIELKRTPEFYKLLSEKGDIDFTMPDNTKQAIAALKEKFPEEKKGIDKFFKIIINVRKEMKKFAELKSWQVKALAFFFPVLFPYLALLSNRFLNITSKTNPLFWLTRPQFGLMKFFTLGTLLDDITNNEELKLILAANIGYYHDDPYTMSLIYFSAAQASYFEGGGWFIKGGSQKLSNYLSNFINKNGGNVLLGKKATEILVENNKAIGVKFQNSFDKNSNEQTIFSNIVIANAALPNVVNLLPKKNGEELNSKIKKLKHACSLLTIYIGFKKDLSKEMGNKIYSTFLIKEKMTLKEYAQSVALPLEKRGFVFVDYSQIDAGLTKKGKTFGTICTWDYLSNWEHLKEEDYKKRKQELANFFVKKLDLFIPGVSEEIEYLEVATPRTIKSYTLSPSGTPYGFAQTPKQSGAFRPSNQSSLKNLYFSSAWSFPGGGFSGAIISSGKCTDIILDKHTPLKNISTPTVEDTQTAKLLDRKKIAKNTFELIFEKPKDFVNMIPGQYAVVTIDDPKYTNIDIPLRPLSIASHPKENVLRFAMRESESAFKKSCLEMNIGDTAKLYGPIGTFSLNNTLKEKQRGIAFLISGIGITPIIPMLKELEKIKTTREVYLFYSNKTEESTSYHNEIKNIQLPHFKYVNRFTSSQGRMTTDLIKKEVENPLILDYYIVGTSSFIKGMKTILSELQVEKERWHIDDFG